MEKRYHSHKANCRLCGCYLESFMPLGSMFVMDCDGNFYCTECESKVPTEEIYEEDE